jgi:hypothetical protein
VQQHQNLWAHLLMLLALACGGQADFELAPDVESIPYDIPQPREAGPVLGEATVNDGAFDLASQDKAFWITNGSQSFYVPTRYGTKSTSYQRCDPDPALWTENCFIPQFRKVRLSVDPSGCEAVNVQMSWAFTDAVSEFKDFARANWGWDVTMSGQGVPLVVVNCQTPGDGAWGEYEVANTGCWIMPGYPEKLCFFSTLGTVRVNVVSMYNQVIQSQKTLQQMKSAMRNVVWHELGHVLGLGHEGQSTSVPPMLMSTFPSASVYTTSLFPTVDQQFRLKNFSRTGNACNWQPGDAVGDSCPSQ